MLRMRIGFVVGCIHKYNWGLLEWRVRCDKDKQRQKKKEGKNLLHVMNSLGEGKPRTKE